MQTIELAPNANMIEVSRRFRNSEGTQVIRAIHRRGTGKLNPAHWAMQFIGPVPNMFGMIYDQDVINSRYYRELEEREDEREDYY